MSSGALWVLMVINACPFKAMLKVKVALEFRLPTVP